MTATPTPTRQPQSLLVHLDNNCLKEILDCLDFPSALKLKELCQDTKKLIETGYFSNRKMLSLRLEEIDRIAAKKLTSYQNKIQDFKNDVNRNWSNFSSNPSTYCLIKNRASRYFVMPPGLPPARPTTKEEACCGLVLLLLGITGVTTAALLPDSPGGIKLLIIMLSAIVGIMIGSCVLTAQLSDYCKTFRSQLDQLAQQFSFEDFRPEIKQELSQISLHYLQTRATLYYQEKTQVDSSKITTDSLTLLVLFYRLAKICYPHELDAVNRMFDELFNAKRQIDGRFSTDDLQAIFDQYQSLKDTVIIHVMDDEEPDNAPRPR